MRPLRQATVNPGVFSKIVQVQIPEKVFLNSLNTKTKPFSISFTADGDIPFPQIIIRANGNEYIFNYDKIKNDGNNKYSALIPETDIPAGTYDVQIEGCRRKEWQQSAGEDWIKTYGELHIVAESQVLVNTAVSQGSDSKKKNR